MVFSVTVNGETVTSEPAAANGTLSFELTVKAGDTIIFTITNSGSAYSTMIGLKVSVVEEFKLYTAQDIKEEGICNKVFTLQKGSALAELVPPSGYEDFFERREIYPGLTLFVQIPEAITVDGRFLTSGNITNILNNFQKVEISAPSIWMLTCKVADIHMGEVYWTFTELYPNILNGASEAIEAIVAEKLKNQPACIAYKKISSYDVNGWDMFELWGGEKDAWILEEGASFIFIPTNAAGVAKPASISVDGGFGSLRVKEYDSSGNLTDPTLFSGKPVLLYNNGTNFIVVK